MQDIKLNARSYERYPHQLRPVQLIRQISSYAEGSVLIEIGRTAVLCNASVEEGVPRFISKHKPIKKGWVTAEYSMLPRATKERVPREATRGKQTGRTLEIQRLIARTLRSVVDLSTFPNHTIMLDCDVLHADGGTRTAAITGGYVALVEALRSMRIGRNKVLVNPLRGAVAAVSVGICENTALLDLDYEEDSRAETDMNIVMDDQGRFIEIQGTAEGQAFSREQLGQLLDLAKEGINQLLKAQKEFLDDQVGDKVC